MSLIYEVAQRKSRRDGKYHVIPISERKDAGIFKKKRKKKMGKAGAIRKEIGHDQGLGLS